MPAPLMIKVIERTRERQTSCKSNKRNGIMASYSIRLIRTHASVY